MPSPAAIPGRHIESDPPYTDPNYPAAEKAADRFGVEFAERFLGRPLNLIRKSSLTGELGGRLRFPMSVTSPILIDPTNFAHARGAGFDQPNPYLFVKNGFLYEVLVDFTVPQLDVWKSALDGSGRVRCDAAHHPPAGTSPWDSGNAQYFAYSRQDSTKIGICFATSNTGVTARIIKFVEFDAGNDQYGTYSPELNVHDRLLDGGALFQKANGTWYLVCLR